MLLGHLQQWHKNLYFKINKNAYFYPKLINVISLNIKLLRIN